MRILLLQIFLGLSLFKFAYALKVIPPLNGVYVSAFADFGPGADEVTVEAIDDYKLLSGKDMAWAYFANNWDEGIVFPDKNFSACKERGVVPYVRLMPWSKQVSKVRKADAVYKLNYFINGKFDKELTEYAIKVKNFKDPVMLEFGPEANGDWFPWNGRWNGAGKTTSYGDPKWPDGPERFRDAFRHIINLFRTLDVQNVTWVVHLDTSYTPHVWWNQMKYYYPGDEYIDWIGLSVFGAQLPKEKWQMFSEKIFGEFQEIQELSQNKPILIAEFAVIEDAKLINRKTEWLEDTFDFIQMGTLPQIKGLSYWHSKGWLANGKANFRIDSSTKSLNEYRTILEDPFWISKVQVK